MGGTAPPIRSRRRPALPAASRRGSIMAAADGLLLSAIGALLLTNRDLIYAPLLLLLTAYWCLQAAATIVWPSRPTRPGSLAGNADRRDRLLEIAQPLLLAVLSLLAATGALNLDDDLTGAVFGGLIIALGLMEIFRASRGAGGVVGDAVLNGVLGAVDAFIGITILVGEFSSHNRLPAVAGPTILILGLVIFAGAIPALIAPARGERRLRLELQGVDDLLSDPVDQANADYAARQPGVERLVNELSAGPVPESVHLTVRLPAAACGPDTEALLHARLATYCRTRLGWQGRDLSAQRRNGLSSLRYALPLLAFTYALAALVSISHVLGDELRQFLSDGLAVAGWVALWDPVYLLLMPMVTYRREGQLLRVLAEAELTLAPLPPGESTDHAARAVGGVPTHR